MNKFILNLFKLLNLNKFHNIKIISLLSYIFNVSYAEERNFSKSLTSPFYILTERKFSYSYIFFFFSFN